MNIRYFRPRVENLIFSVYTQPIQTELLQSFVERNIQYAYAKLTLKITSTGHILIWEKDGHHLTEVIGLEDDPWPTNHNPLRLNFQTEQRRKISLTPKISYQMSCQVEVLSPEIFQYVHEEILADGAYSGMLYHFESNHRFSVSPLGFITIDSLKEDLAISTFHTFPDELTIVKTQSLIQINR